MVRGAIIYMKAEPKEPGKRTPRPGHAPVPTRLRLALAVDLPAAEEEQVDPPLAGQVEQLPRALGEGVAAALVQQRQAHRMAQLLHQPAGRGRDGGGGADRDMPRRRRIGVQDQPGERGGEAFLGTDAAHSAAAARAPKTSRVQPGGEAGIGPRHAGVVRDIGGIGAVFVEQRHRMRAALGDRRSSVDIGRVDGAGGQPLVLQEIARDHALHRHQRRASRHARWWRIRAGGRARHCPPHRPSRRGRRRSRATAPAAGRSGPRRCSAIGVGDHLPVRPVRQDVAADHPAQRHEGHALLGRLQHGVDRPGRCSPAPPASRPGRRPRSAARSRPRRARRRWSRSRRRSRRRSACRSRSPTTGTPSSRSRRAPRRTRALARATEGRELSGGRAIRAPSGTLAAIASRLIGVVIGFPPGAAA